MNLICRLCSNTCHKYFNNFRIKRLFAFHSMNLVSMEERAMVQSRKISYMKKSGNPNVPCTFAYLQIIGSGAKGAGKSVLLFTDHVKFLFNCGENTQRTSHEHRIKIARIEHIFITSATWENIGGLPGISLTLQDCAVKEIKLYGPHGVDELFRNRFISLTSLLVRMIECGEDAVYNDANFTINYVLLVSEQDGNQSDNRETEDIKRAHKSNMKKVSMAYICKMRPKPGTLNLEACVEKGVPPGPLLGKLKNGLDITLPNGDVVKSADVCEPPQPGPVFIVLECPTMDFIEPLLKCEKFCNYKTGCENEENVAKYVLHFTPMEVMKDERYKGWMASFGNKTLHVNVNDGNTCMGSGSVHVSQHKMHLVDPHVFPLLKDDSIRDVVMNYKPKIDKLASLPSKDIFRRAATRLDNIKTYDKERSGLNVDDLNLPPECGYTLRCLFLRGFYAHPNDKDPFVYFDSNRAQNEAKDMPGFVEALASLKEKYETLSLQKTDDKTYPIVTFLGTGSSVPNKTRNTSGILISLSEDKNMIMDCGEGTYAQLLRFFGPEVSDEFLANVRAIFVSHLHPDHHMGLIGLLKARREALQRLKSRSPHRLLLLAPRTIGFWLTLYQHEFENIIDCYELLHNHNWDATSDASDEIAAKKILDMLDLKVFETTSVIHCPNSYGVSITHQDGWKLTYSGDTMPCQSLVDIGKDSDILIHEASMEDNLLKEARLKMHSTVSQAINIGKMMNAKHIILTHFSQRYARIPVLNKDIPDNVGIAFDNMRVSFSDLKKLPLMIPALKCLYAEEVEVMEYKNIKRKRRLSHFEDLQVSTFG